jgi:hypothetical protein
VLWAEVSGPEGDALSRGRSNVRVAGRGRSFSGLRHDREGATSRGLRDGGIAITGRGDRRGASGGGGNTRLGHCNAI